MTNDTIRKFNRDTVWLATGVLGTVVFAALVLVIQEYQPKAKQVESGLLADANRERADSAPSKVAGGNGKMALAQRSSADHGSTETPILETPSAPGQTGVAIPALPLPLADPRGTQASRDDRISVHQGASRRSGPKAQNGRSSWPFRTVDVKRRLIELWHLSLARSAKARTWTAFSNLHRGATKKAAYTAAMGH